MNAHRNPENDGHPRICSLRNLGIRNSQAADCWSFVGLELFLSSHRLLGHYPKNGFCPDGRPTSRNTRFDPRTIWMSPSACSHHLNSLVRIPKLTMLTRRARRIAAASPYPCSRLAGGDIQRLFGLVADLAETHANTFRLRRGNSSRRGATRSVFAWEQLRKTW